MSVLDFSTDHETQTQAILFATVLATNADGSVRCASDDEQDEVVLCDLLQTSAGPALRLSPGERVLLWRADPEDRGVILGRIGGRKLPAASPKTPETPDELVIEAKKNLTFKCGDGSITLRGDGKILIKGKDLVSHAQQMNRIKGGGVAIN